jgi:hypothetical protein
MLLDYFYYIEKLALKLIQKKIPFLWNFKKIWNIKMVTPFNISTKLDKASHHVWCLQIHLVSPCLFFTSCKELTNEKNKYVEAYKLFKA